MGGGGGGGRFTGGGGRSEGVMLEVEDGRKIVITQEAEGQEERGAAVELWPACGERAAETGQTGHGSMYIYTSMYPARPGMVDAPKPAYASCTYPQRSKRDYTGRTGGFFFSFFFFFFSLLFFPASWGGTGGAGGRTEGRKEGRKEARQAAARSCAITSHLKCGCCIAWLGDAHVPVDTGTKYPGHGVSGLAGT